jgi:putative membrane protein
MTVRWILAAAHLLALGIGLGAVWARGRSLRRRLDVPELSRVFAADAWWGVAALIWLSTGLVRLFAATEKSIGYYFENRFFLLKLALFILIVVLEIGPAITLVRWRLAVRRGELPGTERAIALARISAIQTVLVVAIVFAATAMARGVGSP